MAVARAEVEAFFEEAAKAEAEALLKEEFCPAFSPRCISLEVRNASSFTVKQKVCSEPTRRGSLCFRLQVYPRGCVSGKGQPILASVEVMHATASPGQVCFGICLVNRRDICDNIMLYGRGSAEDGHATTFRTVESLADPELGWMSTQEDSLLFYCTARLLDEAEASFASKMSEPGVSGILSLATNLTALWSGGEQGDLILSADGVELKAHGVILAAWSPVFKQMLQSGLMEASMRRIEITDVSAETLKHLCQFLYSGAVDHEVWMTDEALIALTQAAHKYLVTGLVSLCDAEAAERVSVNSVGKWLRLASQYRLERLQSFCMKLVAAQLPEVEKTEGWQHFVRDKQAFLEMGPLLFEAMAKRGVKRGAGSM